MDTESETCSTGLCGTTAPDRVRLPRQNWTPTMPTKKTARQINEEFRANCQRFAAIARGVENRTMREEIAGKPGAAWSVYSALHAVVRTCKVVPSVEALMAEVAETLTPEQRANPLKCNLPHFAKVLRVAADMSTDPLGGVFHFPSVVKENDRPGMRLTA